MWFPLFVFGGLLFWGLCAAELLFVIASLHFRRGGQATVSLGIFLVALWLFGDINVFLWAWNNPQLMGWGSLAYIAVAASWGFAKWTLYQRENSFRYLELRAEFLKEKKVEGEVLPTTMKGEWEEWFNRNNRSGDWEEEIDTQSQYHGLDDFLAYQHGLDFD